MGNHYDPNDEEDVPVVTVTPRRAPVTSHATNVQRDTQITRPAHYGGEDNPFEPIKIIEHYGLGFNIGNALKYMLRAPLKGAYIDDLLKAIWYLQRAVDRARRDHASGE